MLILKYNLNNLLSVETLLPTTITAIMSQTLNDYTAEKTISQTINNVIILMLLCYTFVFILKQNKYQTLLLY